MIVNKMTNPAFLKGARFLLALLFLVAVLIPSAQPAQAATVCTRYHTVKRGETLSGIGVRYGISWKKLAAINHLANPNKIYTGQVLCVATKAGTPAKIPTFTIISVVRNQTVTIQTADFPANDTFNVLMGPYGTKGINGIKVTQISSGSGGSFTATFNVPAALKGSTRIAIRLQSPTSGFFSYNWFWNFTTP